MSGPLGLDTYMQLCLHHDPHGYYFSGGGFGREGDFITAPEISPLFGQALARWVNEEWQALGEPERWRLVELGPGRGTLLTSLWPHIDRAPEVLSLVEASPALQQQISDRLAPYVVPSFVSTLGELPESDLPTLIIGNEYLDALPIRQFRRQGDEVSEICVGLDTEGGLTFLQRASQLPCPLPEGQEGYWEVGLAAQHQLDFLCNDLKATSGAILLIDYGYRELPGRPTLQALANHEQISPLEQPGQADLTALVDFGTLARKVATKELSPYLESQADLLLRLGFAELLEARPDQAAACARLLREDAMGTLFQALSFRAARP